MQILKQEQIIKHQLPELGYAYNSLEPFIDTKTMEIHYTKHHQAYIDKLNTALEPYPELQKKSAPALLKNLDSIPENIRTAVRNHGGGHFNHTFFWPLLRKNTPITGKDIEKAITKKYGSYENFRQEFTKASLSLFGSGWVWLTIDKGNLEIIQTNNQDTPISSGKTPLLAIDLWEHSYYLKHQHKRASYVEDFFNVINWNKVNELYINSNGKF